LLQNSQVLIAVDHYGRTLGARKNRMKQFVFELGIENEFNLGNNANLTKRWYSIVVPKVPLP
jgi:hypothetical protein